MWIVNSIKKERELVLTKVYLINDKLTYHEETNYVQNTELT